MFGSFWPLCKTQTTSLVYFEFACLPFFLSFLSLQKSADSTAKRTTMPALSAPTNINSSPPSPADSSSSRRLSWGRLVQRLADFSASSSSVDSGSNRGSSSDLSDTGKKMCQDLQLLIPMHACTFLKPTASLQQGQILPVTFLPRLKTCSTIPWRRPSWKKWWISLQGAWEKPKTPTAPYGAPNYSSPRNFWSTSARSSSTWQPASPAAWEGLSSTSAWSRGTSARAWGSCPWTPTLCPPFSWLWYCGWNLRGCGRKFKDSLVQSLFPPQQWDKLWNWVLVSVWLRRNCIVLKDCWSKSVESKKHSCFNVRVFVNLQLSLQKGLNAMSVWTE